MYFQNIYNIQYRNTIVEKYPLKYPRRFFVVHVLLAIKLKSKFASTMTTSLIFLKVFLRFLIN